MGHYVAQALGDPIELRAFYQVLLISLTRFFRNASAFSALEETVVARVVANEESRRPIRCWVAACCSGEEAYSLAICLLEALAKSPSSRGLAARGVQVFATDIDDAAIEQGRAGWYPRAIESQVSADRLARFFVPSDGGYKVAHELRDVVIFSRHNLLQDPPLWAIDVLSCRNLLIYLRPAAQKAVLTRLHSALSPLGHLFLGAAETPSAASQLFRCINVRARVFESIDLPGGSAPRARRILPSPARRRPPTRDAGGQASLQTLADRALLSRYTPAALVVDRSLTIASVRGGADRYLAAPSSGAGHHLLRLLRPDLIPIVQHAVVSALQGNPQATAEGSYQDGCNQCHLRVEVLPLASERAEPGHFLVAFCPRPPPEAPPPTGGARRRTNGQFAPRQSEPGAPSTRRSSPAARGAQADRGQGRAHDALRSANEDLWAANAELESSKDQLQATNEEMIAINDDLQARVNEFDEARQNLRSILALADTAIILVSMDLKVRTFTAEAAAMVALEPKDVGRSVNVLDRCEGQTTMAELVARVINTASSYEGQLVTTGGRQLFLRVSPLPGPNHAIDGAVVRLYHPGTMAAPKGR